MRDLLRHGDPPQRNAHHQVLLQRSRLLRRQCAASDQLQQQRQLLLAKLSRQSALVDDVRQVLLARPGFFPDIEICAAKLNVSVRTLRRRLTGEGTSFQEVLDEVRFGLATEYLVDRLERRGPALTRASAR